jgi:hypothetical protein
MQSPIVEYLTPGSNKNLPEKTDDEIFNTSL